MSPRDRQLWLRFQRRASGLSADISADLFKAYRILRDALDDAELTALIASGRIDELIDDALLDRSVLPLRARLAKSIEKGFSQAVRDLPNGGTVDGSLAVGFDTLNPKIIDAIRALDDRAINTLKADIRETVRAHVENGLRDGASARSIGKDLRGVIGLAPNQAEAVANYRKELESGERGLHRALRDRRFDTADMTPDRIDRAVDAYRKKMLAHNANTVSSTMAKDAMKAGQRLSWDDAIAKGIVDSALLDHTWIAVAGPGGDGRNRPEHLAMHGETVPYANTFSNGDTIPGESDWNCRCIERVTVRRQAA